MNANQSRRWLLWVLLAWLGFSTAAQAFYDPNVGRWVNRDPIGDLGFIIMGNPKSSPWRKAFKDYGMVGNNPIDKLDAEGLWVVCCRSVNVEPGESKCWKVFRHCDIAENASKCDPGSDSYPIIPDPKCPQKPCPDTKKCLEENKYDAGDGLPGSNCQSNTRDRLKKCCLLAPTWRPNFYAYPFVDDNTLPLPGR